MMYHRLGEPLVHFQSFYSCTQRQFPNLDIGTPPPFTYWIFNHWCYQLLGQEVNWAELISAITQIKTFNFHLPSPPHTASPLYPTPEPQNEIQSNPELIARNNESILGSAYFSLSSLLRWGGGGAGLVMCFSSRGLSLMFPSFSYFLFACVSVL